jgi:hypothetical protein
MFFSQTHRKLSNSQPNQFSRFDQDDVHISRCVFVYLTVFFFFFLVFVFLFFCIALTHFNLSTPHRSKGTKSGPASPTARSTWRRRASAFSSTLGRADTALRGGTYGTTTPQAPCATTQRARATASRNCGFTMKPRGMLSTTRAGSVSPCTRVAFTTLDFSLAPQSSEVCRPGISTWTHNSLFLQLRRLVWATPRWVGGCECAWKGTAAAEQMLDVIIRAH